MAAWPAASKGRRMTGMTRRVRKSRRRWRKVAALATSGVVLLAVLIAAPPATASGLVVESVILAHGADDPLNPSGRTTNFAGVDTVFAVVRLDGLPKAGVVTGTFSFRGKEMNRASFDMKDNRRVSRLEDDTFVTFTFAPIGGTKLPIGTSYKLKILLDGKVDGSVGFSVLPPKGAFPSKAIRLRLVAEDGKARKTFAPSETVTVQLLGDLGLDSWIEVKWTVGGTVDPDGTQSASITKPGRNSVIAFSHKPASGWPIGKHSLALVMDDRPAGEVAFTVR